MFFKHALVAMALATSAVLASVTPGTYMITSAETDATIRVYQVGSPLFVRATVENPGPFGLFDIQNGGESGGQFIRAYGLNTNVVAAAIADGGPVVSVPYRPPTEFQISSAEGGTYTIQVANEDLLWTIEGANVEVYGQVNLRHAEGSSSQRFTLQLAQLE